MSSATGRRLGRGSVTILWAAALLLIGGAGLESLTLALAFGEVQQGSSALLQATDRLGAHPEQWTPDRISAAGRLNRTAGPLLERGCARLQSNPIPRAAGGLPVAGADTTAVLDLCDAGIAASRSLDDFLRVARAYQAVERDPAPPGARFIKLLSETGAPLRDADARLRPVLARLRQDLARPLAPPLRAKVAEAAGRLADAEQRAALGLGMSEQLGPALGSSRPTTYLVLLENPGEMRPSGGLIGSVGTITFANGAPSQLEIRPYDDYNRLLKQRFPIPSPLDRLMSFYNNALEIGDAGWDPDFPTTARLAEAMYKSATGLDVDGTIAFDPYAISALLAVTGPVSVPTFGTFSAADVYAQLNYIINVQSAYPHEGKQALPVVGREVLKTVLAQPIAAWPRLLDVFQQQARGRHLQIEVHDAALAKSLAAGDVDGSIAATPGDYLMVVDANVGATKGDLYANKSMSVRSEVYADGLSRHLVTIDYSLPAFNDDLARALNPGDGSYRDYLRFYLPEHAAVAGVKASLDSQPSVAAPVNVTQEHGRAVVGVFFILPPQHSLRLQLAYEVPLQVGRSYSLFIQKQAGSPGLPTDLLVSYPGGRAERHLALDRDEEVGYRW